MRFRKILGESLRILGPPSLQESSQNRHRSIDCDRAEEDEEEEEEEEEEEGQVTCIQQKGYPKERTPR